MKEILEVIVNGSWWQSLLTSIGIAIVARCIYTILTDKEN